MEKRVAIFDSDGVLIDTRELLYQILPRRWYRSLWKKPRLWDFVRKLAILVAGDRIYDERLRGIDVEVIRKIAEEYEIFIITKRPFWFGGKKRLMKQLDVIYGEGFFKPEQVFSSFGKSKAKVTEQKILKGEKMQGIFVDDKKENLKGIPAGICPFYFNHYGSLYMTPNGICDIYDLKQVFLVVDFLEGREVYLSEDFEDV